MLHALLVSHLFHKVGHLLHSSRYLLHDTLFTVHSGLLRTGLRLRDHIDFGVKEATEVFFTLDSGLDFTFKLVFDIIVGLSEHLRGGLSCLLVALLCRDFLLAEVNEGVKLGFTCLLQLLD